MILFDNHRRDILLLIFLVYAFLNITFLDFSVLGLTKSLVLYDSDSPLMFLTIPFFALFCLLALVLFFLKRIWCYFLSSVLFFLLSIFFIGSIFFRGCFYFVEEYSVINFVLYEIDLLLSFFVSALFVFLYVLQFKRSIKN